MFTKSHMLPVVRFLLVLVLLSGIYGVLPAQINTIAHALTDPPGTLDITFDNDGLVTTSISDGAGAVAVQTDGKIVIAGGFGNSGYDDFFVARYNDDGSLDTNFDADGIVTTDFGGIDGAGALAIQDDGKIVVAGHTGPDGNTVDFAFARYNTNGSLDTSFDMDGKLITNIGTGYNFPAEVAIQSDGKIVVVGSKYVGINDNDIAVLRFNENGSLDTDFDTDGIVTTSVGSGTDDYGASIAIQPDGKIVVGGNTSTWTNSDFVLARYNINGSLDISFDTDGIVTQDFGFGIDANRERGGHVALQRDDKIIIAGYNSNGYYLLARYNNNGSLDTGFDADGLVATYFDGDPYTTVVSVNLQANGRIILAGNTRSPYGNDGFDFTLVRYNTDGFLDTSFGTDGRVVTDFGSNDDDLVNDVAIQSDGKIVVVGSRHIIDTYPNWDIAMARYIGDVVSNPLTVTKTADTGDGVCDNDCSLRDAIADADAGDTIKFNTALSGQTITLAATLVIDKDLTIDGSALASKIDISGNNSVRVFEIAPNTLVYLQSLIIKDGYSSTDGGSIYNAGSLTVADTIFSDNLADRNGGGIFNTALLFSPSAGTLTVIHSSFLGNSAGGSGGGIFNQDGSLDVFNSTFWNNSAIQNGGGIVTGWGNYVTIVNSIFSENSAGLRGGGIESGGPGNVIITNTTFYKNSGINGGGIYNGALLTIENGTFSDNSAADSGGGIYNDDASIYFTNTILANSTSGNDCYSTGENADFPDDINNLVETNATFPNNCGTPASAADPNLGPLQNNGGYTQTMALLPGSPAIDAGDDDECPVTDQRGVLRPQGSHCDMGAYEVKLLPTSFNKSSPSNGATGQPANPTLVWGTSSGASSYEYCYDTSNDNACSGWTSNGTSTSKTLSGLSAGTTYYWHVRAINTGGTTYSNSSKTTYWSFTIGTVPGAFNKIAPVNGVTGQPTSPTLSWETSSGATSYEYCYDTSNDNSCSNWNSNGTSTSKALSGLSANTTYYWHVRAVNGFGNSYSNSSSTTFWSFTTTSGDVTPPSVPALVSPANNFLTTNYTPTLDWSNSTLPVGVIFDHYQIQIATDAGFSDVIRDQSITGISNSSYTLSSDLVSNTKFYWRVRAVNLAGGISNWSTVWAFRTALTPPTLVSPTDGFNALDLRPVFDWSDIAETGVTGYTMQISRNNTFTQIVHTGNLVASTYIPNADLVKNTLLYWRVQTRGTNGPSGWSEIRSFTSANSPSTPNPTSPANNALNTDYLPLFKWSAATLPAGSLAFQHYQLQVDDNADFSSPVLDDTSVTNIATLQLQTVTPLAHNTKFYWRIRAVNVDNEASNWSAVWFFRTALTPPTLVSPIDGFSPLELRPTFDWDDVVETGVSGYTIQIAKNNTFTQIVHTGNPVASNYIPTADLVKNTLLYWRVRTKGANGPSAWSEVRSFTSANSPSTPVLVVPANNSLNTNYLPLFKWTASTLPAGTTFQYYQLQVDNNADFSSPELNDTSITDRLIVQFQTVTPLTHNTKFYWRVRAINTDNEVSNWSAVRTLRTALTPPTLLSPLDATNAFSLRPTFDWDDVAETGVTGYTLQISKNNTFTQIVHTGNPAASNYIPTADLVKNTLLYWRAQTKGTNGPSAWSEVRSFTSANSPSTPVLVAPANNALNTDYIPLFKWKAVTLPAGTTFDHYQIQVDDNADFSSTVLDENSAITQFQTVMPLAHNTKFYWRVRAFNTDNEVSNWSAVWTFRTILPAPTLLTPADLSAVGSLKPVFDWTDASGPGAITGYTIQISTSPTFNSILMSATIVNSTYTPLNNLPAGKTLYWRVRINGANGPSLYSTSFTFLTP